MNFDATLFHRPGRWVGFLLLGWMLLISLSGVARASDPLESCEKPAFDRAVLDEPIKNEDDFIRLFEKTRTDYHEYMNCILMPPPPR
ncbi:hypothetical protein IPJ72_07055 [Candidatus Peregrinibacteria bacterium]|nr:MAG: hypothetical protein IPJ72_07055 [Candidatus Peregrinibacteria bacterium]